MMPEQRPYRSKQDYQTPAVFVGSGYAVWNWRKGADQ